MMRAIDLQSPAARAALRGWKRVLSQSLHRHGIDHRAFAEACEVDPSMVSRWCSTTTPDAIGAKHIALAAPTFPLVAFDLVSWMADQVGASIASRQPGELRDPECLITVLRGFHGAGARFEGACLACASEGLRGPHLEELDKALREVERSAQEARRLVDVERHGHQAGARSPRTAA